MQRTETPCAGFFPRAHLYTRPATRPRVREVPPHWIMEPPDERHVQCVWFDEALRPAPLTTHDGEPVTVEDPGEWNLEAGPDFRGAAIRVGTQQRRIAGDVEVHIHPAGWRQHGHADDPRYANVRIHVTFHPGHFDVGLLPPGSVQIALRDALATRPGFSFDQVDVTAYPFARRAPAPPCQLEIRGWPVAARLQLLEAAGQERLRRKAERLEQLARLTSPEQAIYEETLAALGYKANKQPFRQLARAMPLDVLRDEARGDVTSTFALLCGVAGLLPEAPRPDWDATTRQFFRVVWDAWWKRREQFAGVQLAAGSWQLAGQRPANHPLRRLMAAAALFADRAGAPASWLELAARQPADFAERWLADCVALNAPYFDRHAIFGGKGFQSPQALIGRERAEALLANVVVPFLASRHVAAPFAGGLLAKLPPEADNAIIRQAAMNLLGRDFPPSHLRSALRRQGLIQIFHDYCVHDRSRCATCSFPVLLKRSTVKRTPQTEETI